MVLGIFHTNEQHLIIRDFIAFSKVCVDLPTQWQMPLNLERALFCASDTRRGFLLFSFEFCCFVVDGGFFKKGNLAF